MRSLRPLATLKTDSPDPSLPEYTRKNASWPDKRVGHDLEHQRRRTARCRTPCAR